MERRIDGCRQEIQRIGIGHEDALDVAGIDFYLAGNVFVFPIQGHIEFMDFATCGQAGINIEGGHHFLVIQHGLSPLFPYY